MHAFGLVAERPARGTRSAEGLRVGVHPKVVQERLGHANVGITLDTYSHVMPGMQEIPEPPAFSDFEVTATPA